MEKKTSVVRDTVVVEVESQGRGASLQCEWGGRGGG